MQKSSFLIGLLLALLLPTVAPAAAAASPTPSDAQTTANVQQAWKLLDYLATDYAGAVADGQIIDPAEYAEQQEFSGRVVTLLDKLPASDSLTDLQTQAGKLLAAVDAKAPPAQVDEQAHALAEQLLEAYPVPSAPDQAPDLAAGAGLYQSTCATCHGKTGDGQGPAAANLDPPPIDFTDAARADQRSPLSLYQAITQGLEGTSMAGYADSLSDLQRWDLAYYIGTMAYAADAPAGDSAWHADDALRARVSNLDELSHLRVAQLTPAFGNDTARAVVGWLRAHPQAVEQAPQGIALARARLAASLAAYRNEQGEQAVQLALSAYLDGVEPEEPRLDARNHALRSRIETAMGAYRTSLAKQQSAELVAERAATADDLLAEAADLLAGSTASPSTAFVGAYTILVREGLEALLVIVALLAFLRKAEQPRVARYVHIGWILALLAGVLTWAVARYFISISGASRELTEGLSALFAAAVLLGVGLWMHGKSKGDRWQTWLKQKMNAAMQQRSAWFLFVLAFVTVYREVFETILFYIALWSDGQHGWMLGGMGAGAVTLAVIAWILLKTSMRLPLHRFFQASSALIALLAFVLAGKGAAALQEAGWLHVSLLHGMPRIGVLGIYPTRETLLAQLVVVVLLVAGFLYNGRRARQLEAAGT